LGLGLVGLACQGEDGERKGFRRIGSKRRAV
jgi:hypothetical protein